MDKNEALDVLFGTVLSDMKKDAEEKVEKISQEVLDKISAMQEKIDESVKSIDSILSSKPITVNLGTIEKPSEQVVHSQFSNIINILKSAKRKEKNIMLVGGAGGGKTHLVKQVAEALKLPFYPMSVGVQTTKSDLMGFINATGVYMPSIIRTAYENGGVLLLDEFDAAHPGVVTILNSLLANGHASFPDKVIEKNEKFICICACNTYGRGANIDYVGRNRLDGATLDRFIVINVDYDEKVERALANNDSWVDVIVKIRKNIEQQGIKMIVSPRASIDGADLLEAGFAINDVVDMVILKGCDDDIKKKVLKNISLKGIKKKPNRNTAEVSAQETTSITDRELPDIEITVDFDKGVFLASFVDEFVIGNESGFKKSEFTICGNDCYLTYLDENTLYVKNTEGKFVPFDSIYHNDESVNRFINAIQNQVSVYCGKYKVDLTVVHKGNSVNIRLGDF